jgi:hypothetical protein
MGIPSIQVNLLGLAVVLNRKTMSASSAWRSLSLGSKRQSHRQRREKRYEFMIKSEVRRLQVVKKRDEITPISLF